MALEWVYIHVLCFSDVGRLVSAVNFCFLISLLSKVEVIPPCRDAVRLG